MAAAFQRRVVTLAPESWHPFVEDDWRDCLVLVERGEVELHSCGGTRSFETGAVLWFTGLGLRVLHNPGRTDAVLVAISRGR